MNGYGPLQERNYFLSPKMMTQFLTGRKDGQSLEALGHAFYCEMELTTTVQKLSKSSQSDQGGEQSHHRPLNTPLVYTVHNWHQQ